MNRIYLQRACKIMLKAGSKGSSSKKAPGENGRKNKKHSKSKKSNNFDRTTGALLKNIEGFGFTLSPEVVEIIETYNPVELGNFYRNLVRDLKVITGANKPFKPMYPDFPSQVMEMSSVALYLNAIYHYWTLKLPDYKPHERPAIDEDSEFVKKNLKIIGLGSTEDFKSVLTLILSSSQAFSPHDKDDVKWFLNQFSGDVDALLPEEFPCKENLAFVTSLVMSLTPFGSQMVKFFKTSTDVLRLAVALSDGDVSLKEPCRFRTFTRKERSLLLSMVEGSGNENSIAEDMNRWKSRWLRLGERIHPGDYKKKFPKAFKAFQIIRNNGKISTFNSQVEEFISGKNLPALVTLLKTRPGEYARRLDHLLRLEMICGDGPGEGSVSGDGSGKSHVQGDGTGEGRLHGDYNDENSIVSTFSEVASEVSTNVLLQVMNHFRNRESTNELRIFFPKGAVGNLFAVDKSLPAIPMDGTVAISKICEETLVKRFSGLPALGKCYLDNRLKNYMAPFAMRSASKALRTIVRGSRVPIPVCEVLRMFIWWKNGTGRVDLDLSAAMYDENLNYIDGVSFQNLENFGAVHSGDIVDAPQGAAEFIDVDIQKCLEQKVRYIVTSLNSYTEQPYCDLPECFTGWMARNEAGSGEIFEPKTVRDKIDVTADTRCCLPAIFDIVNHEMIWADIGLKSDPRFANSLTNNLGGVSLMLRAMVNLSKTSLYDLFLLHIAGRGTLVETIDEAETVFSVEEGITPLDLEVISSQFMG